MKDYKETTVFCYCQQNEELQASFLEVVENLRKIFPEDAADACLEYADAIINDTIQYYGRFVVVSNEQREKLASAALIALNQCAKTTNSRDVENLYFIKERCSLDLYSCSSSLLLEKISAGPSVRLSIGTWDWKIVKQAGGVVTREESRSLH